MQILFWPREAGDEANPRLCSSRSAARKSRRTRILSDENSRNVVKLVAEHIGRALFLYGGTLIHALLAWGLSSRAEVLNDQRCASLSYIEIADGTFTLSAMTPFREVAEAA